MKFAEHTAQSADYLRQAVPLMVQHGIAPTPINYALWYTYVSKRLPTLNQQLDMALETYGTCPTLVGEQLFREHLIHEIAADPENTRNQLFELTAGLHQQAHRTQEHTREFVSALEESQEVLANTDSPMALESILQELTQKSHTMREIAQLFQQHMEEAEQKMNHLKQGLAKTKQDRRLDPLTGLFSRNLFDQELDLITGAKSQLPISLILMDVDCLNAFNEKYGHLMGDKILQYIAKIIKEQCTEPLLPARFSGGSFSVICQGQEAAQAASLAESLRGKIESIRIKQRNSGKVISTVTASFGVYQHQGEGAKQLLERTQGALHNAKNQGRNQVAYPI